MVQVRQRVLIALAALSLAALPVLAQKFYPDDPLEREPRPLDVKTAEAQNLNDYYDFFRNTFWPPDREQIKHHNPLPSEAINTLGEVPDSTWFTNRVGSRPMTVDELVRGPGTDDPPSTSGPWTVVSGKNQGVQPGLIIRDARRKRYFLKFDPMSYPDMATAADVIGAKFFYDLGYNTPQNYIVRFPPSRLRVAPQSRYRGENGQERQMTEKDIEDVLAKVPRGADGRYRGMASRDVGGDLIGPFRYSGTRSDDPNDIVRHERRRDLRGLYVFAAWLNHTDSKSINSMDTIVDEGGVHYIKHFLIDFGAILGSDTFEPKSPRAGNVFLFSWKPSAMQFATLGFDVKPWMRLHYPDLPGAGHFQYEDFDPEHWTSNYPNPAFELRTPGDLYWAAKKVMAFRDEDIRAIVATGQYDDARTAEWISRCLIERRNRIGRAFFAEELPLDHFAVRGGRLEFEDLAAEYGFHAPQRYSVAWSVFDNATGRRTSIPNATTFQVPAAHAEYLAARIHSADPDKTVTVYLRGRQVVGIDRTP